MPDLVIARTISITGEAYAQDSLGELRALSDGDVLMEGETIFTAEASTVKLELMNGVHLDITESSRRELHRDLLDEIQASSADGGEEESHVHNSGSRFCEIDDGEAVQSASGHNVYFDQRPLYWQLGDNESRVQAIVHMPTEDDFVDIPILEIALSDDGFCKVAVSKGEFALENHNIPFTTGNPEPGVPVKFFGIAEGGETSEAQASDSCSAEVSSIGVTNTWYLEGDTLAFEFTGEPGNLLAEGYLARQQGSRAINNFSFRNAGPTPASFMVRAFSGDFPHPVYEAGSEEKPIKLPEGAVFSVISQLHYDQLLLIPVDSCGNCNKLQLHMEGFSEFEPGDISFELPVAGKGLQGEVAQGTFCFDVYANGRGHSELRFETSVDEVAYDSVWEQLGLQSNLAPGDQH